MHDDKPDRFVDDLLEASLARYRGEEPRAGLEMRVLAGVRSRERAARRRWLGWAVAGCAGLVAVIALTLHFARAPRRQPTPSASLGQPAAKAPAMASEAQPSLRPSGPVQRAGEEPRTARTAVRATKPTRPEQFPTPMPLTEQEKLLLAYVSKAGKAGLAEGANATGQTPITELTISAIKIAPLEIKPLDSSQSD